MYKQFVPPCCWRGSLADHQSPAATRLREEIDSALASGESDSEIKQQVIHEYSKAILRVPEGATGEVVFLVPVCIILVSILALSALLVSWAKRSKVVPFNAAVDDRRQHWRKIAEADSQWQEFEGGP